MTDQGHAAVRTITSAPVDVSVGAPAYGAVALNAADDNTVLVGRRGDLPAGIDPEDAGVSRVALRVTATADGWHLELSNSNGGLVFPWAQGDFRLDSGERRTLRWPRVAIMLIGSLPQVRHWVYLEADDYTPAVARAVPGSLADELPGDSTGLRLLVTKIPRPPRSLTQAQLDAVQTVFTEHLQWPPRLPPRPMKQESAGRRLKVKANAVQFRLDGALAKARALGFHGAADLDRPDWVHVLVRAGLLPFPANHVDARPYRG